MGRHENGPELGYHVAVESKIFLALATLELGTWELEVETDDGSVRTPWLDPTAVLCVDLLKYPGSLR
ncbi:hypothetical protein SAMD00023353_0101940 [Rosellinia necatrix]|uniref:Uncharacterized protein n=1 Tax=Rosellinia necatrix TaxID=77044 RepID=A0A1S8A4Q2_ROSNE|nr:hypothetical protein SAMD00023353_0101940 [Rosellinia necatrix]